VNYQVKDIKRADYVKTCGLAFIEFSGPRPELLSDQFFRMGFAKTAIHKTRSICLYTQGDVRFISNTETGGHTEAFRRQHTRGVSALGFRVKDAAGAFKQAIALGAKEAKLREYDIPAIEGVGRSIIYLVDQKCQSALDRGFDFSQFTASCGTGLHRVDHLTHNLKRGNLSVWVSFYETIFGFNEVRSFDIEGKATGLFSKVVASPDGQLIIPLNESKDEHSQIEEFLNDYNGEGVQHIALTSDDLYKSVSQISDNGIELQNTPDAYYELVDKRIPGHGEDLGKLKELGILIDGGEAQGGGKLLQIFTKKSIGPIFFEFIQRKGNEGFGEGNFQALFESIELDQFRRGVIGLV